MHLPLVATLVSYLGSVDAVDCFVVPSAAEVWLQLATELEGVTQASQLQWPALNEGVVLAGQTLFAQHGDNVHVRRLLAATIRAFAEKSAFLGHLYVYAKEMVLPTAATPEDQDHHRNPIASSSAYYFNPGCKIRYSLAPYDTEEVESAVDCSKTVRERSK